jgi:beta-glucanase (GH16 family)
VHDENGKGMEIDIMEHLTRHGPYRYNIAAHWDGYGKDHKSIGSECVYVEPTKDGWLVAGLLWEPGRMTWYCNGRKVGQWRSDRIPDVPLFLKLTMQMGGWGGNRIVDSELPDVFQVDYVRAWQRSDLGKPASK